MRVALIVPYRPGCAHRAAAWAWVRERYETQHPALRVVEAREQRSPGPQAGHSADAAWVKAHAVMPAVEDASEDLIVVADADVWTDQLPAAIAAAAGGVAWAIPHRGVYRVTEQHTREILAGSDPDLEQLEQRAYLGVEGGGITVAWRSVLLDCPLDPRFTGWGQEDDAWGCALTTLHDRPWRGKGRLLHLWHPPQPRASRRVGNPAGEELAVRYHRAMRDAADMRALIQEVPGCSPTC